MRERGVVWSGMIVAVAGTMLMATGATGVAWAGPGAEEPVARNVIFLLADGMGVSMAASAEVLSFDADGEFAMTAMPVVGLVRTEPLGEAVTDSAASATAYATGRKTANGFVGLLPDGTELRTIVEMAEAQGKATAIVTTTDLTDASPASFAAHVPNRRMQADIYQQMLARGVDVLVGGLGTAEGQLAEAAGVDANEGPALARAIAERRGYSFTRDAAAFSAALRESDGPAVFAPAARSGQDDAFGPPLAETLGALLPRLAADDDGFFVFIECEETDSGGHANDTPRVVAGVREIDAALRVALEFAGSHPGTLIVLTADHDTGAFSVGGGQYAGQVGEGETPRPLEPLWVSKRHTAQWVPVFASGPGSSAFTGVMDNTRVFDLMAGAMGLSGR